MVRLSELTLELGDMGASRPAPIVSMCIALGKWLSLSVCFPSAKQGGEPGYKREPAGPALMAIRLRLLAKSQGSQTRSLKAGG